MSELVDCPMTDDFYWLNPFGRYDAWSGITIHRDSCQHAKRKAPDWLWITAVVARRMAELIEHRSPDAPLALCVHCLPPIRQEVTAQHD